MLNQSNKNVPTRRVNFFSFKAQITRELKGTSEIHPLELEVSERIALIGEGDFSPWKTTDFKLTHVWEDSTEQYIY